MQDDPIRSSLANAIVRVFRGVNRVHNRLFRGHEISAEQAHILLILRHSGALTIGKLQKQLSLSSATLTGAIDRLEARGLVQRVPSREDRRAFVIDSKVSPKQMAVLEEVVGAGDRRCFSVLTASERKELLRLLEKCAAHLENAASAN
jgi:DNA-binding MarR family transcriptional regulator